MYKPNLEIIKISIRFIKEKGLYNKLNNGIIIHHVAWKSIINKVAKTQHFDVCILFSFLRTSVNDESIDYFSIILDFQMYVKNNAKYRQSIKKFQQHFECSI